MERVYWFPSETQEDEKFDQLTYYRDKGLMDFVRKVQKDNSIEGVIINDEEHNIGFIIKPNESNN